jgi:hypothetical protein
VPPPIPSFDSTITELGDMKISRILNGNIITLHEIHTLCAGFHTSIVSFASGMWQVSGAHGFEPNKESAVADMVLEHNFLQCEE